MEFMNSLTEFIMEFRIFGITPFRGLFTLLTSVGFWSVLLGTGIIAFIIFRIFGQTFFIIIGKILGIFFNLIKKVCNYICFVIKESYFMIMFKLYSKEHEVDTVEFWAKRKLTKEGIYSEDTTGVESVLIKHPMVIGKIISYFTISKRAISNILLLIKNLFKKTA